MQLLQGYFIFYCVYVSTEIVQANCNMSTTTTIFNNAFEDPTMICIVELIKKFIHCGALLTLVDRTKRIDPLIKSLSDSDCYVFILRPFHKHWRLLITDVYIISMSNLAQLTSSLNELTKEIGWNPGAKFFISIDELDGEKNIEIFEILLTHNIFDVLLIKEDKNGISKTYNYFPYDDQKCGQVVDDIIKEEDCSYVKTIETNSKSLDNKFQNCTIVVAASEDIVNFLFKSNKEFSYLGTKAEGIEQCLLNNIAQREHFQIEYILAGQDLRYGVVLPNHTITGVLGYLQNNTVSIVGGGFFLISKRVELFDFISGYNYVNLYMFTPAFGEENWKKVYQEFNTITWILIIISFLITTAVVIVVRKYLFGKKDDAILLFIKMWGYIYGHPDPGLFRVRKMRIIIILWILFTYFISSFYNTAYYSLLTRQPEEKVLERPDDLDSLPFIPCITDAIRTFFKFNFNQTLPENTMKSCKYTKVSLDLVANSNKYYAIDMDYSYKLREHRYINKEGYSKFQISKYLVDIIVSMYTKRGFPLLHKFRRYAAYYFESGIFQKYLEEIYHSNKIFHQRHKSKYRNARISDYKVEFYILFFGYFVSSVCFLIEINK